jgi:hypothetical protein
MSEPMQRCNYSNISQWLKEYINMSYFDKNVLMYNSYLGIFNVSNLCFYIPDDGHIVGCNMQDFIVCINKF